MTDETVASTMRVVLTINDREVTVTGENLERLRNSVIVNITKRLKQAAKKARREHLRKSRIAPSEETEETTDKANLLKSLQSLALKIN